MKMPYSWMLVFASSTMFTFNAVSNMVFGKKFLLDTAGLSEGAAEAIICGQTLVGMFALLSGGITTRLTKNKRKPLIVITPAITLATTIMMICTIKFQLPAFFYAAGMILFALAAGLAVVYPMAMQEFNSRDSMTLAAGFNNNCNYLGIAIFSPLVGLLLDHFKVPGMHNYPVEAYLWLYSLALIPAVAAFVVACFIPETGGQFLHKSYQDNIVSPVDTLFDEICHSDGVFAYGILSGKFKSICSQTAAEQHILLELSDSGYPLVNRSCGNADLPLREKD